jgi:Protein of unknown function (DUF2844)
MKHYRVVTGCLAFVAILATSQLAQAFLGGRAESVIADQMAFKSAQRSTTTLNGYTVETIVSEAVTVREYVSPSGTVFAIAWNGYVHPDLSQLLGPYSAEYSANKQKAVRHSGSKRQKLETESIVVDKWGRMKDLHGRAYAPRLVPKGLNLDEIR